jgi:hypothetical protein
MSAGKPVFFSTLTTHPLLLRLCYTLWVGFPLSQQLKKKLLVVTSRERLWPSLSQDWHIFFTLSQLRKDVWPHSTPHRFVTGLSPVCHSHSSTTPHFYTFDSQQHFNTSLRVRNPRFNEHLNIDRTTDPHQSTAKCDELVNLMFEGGFGHLPSLAQSRKRVWPLLSSQLTHHPPSHSIPSHTRTCTFVTVCHQRENKLTPVCHNRFSFATLCHRSEKNFDPPFMEAP